MNLHRVVPASATALALLASLPAADVTLFFGPPGGTGSVEVHDELGGGDVQRPPALQEIVLLPVDFVGRARVLELDPTRPRWRDDVAGASRLELPGGAGSLYRYRRDDPEGGPSAFGFFLVGPDGAARPLFERDGAGALGLDDPYLPKLAVDAAATGLLVATTAPAGGNLLEVELATGAVVDRTETLGPRAFKTNGLALGASLGVGTTADGVLRFDRTQGGAAELVPFPAPAPTFFQGDVALSADGSCVATLAGSGATALDVYCLELDGSAVRVSTVPRSLTGAGYLPEVLDGPHLALSSDGSLAMWSSEELTARETWVRPVLAQGGEEQVTEDARFVDTLDTSGGILPFAASAFLLVVGETDGPGTIDGADVYRVDVDPTTGQPTITNVSGTSGDSFPPFDGGGRIETEEGLWRLPGTDRLLVFGDTDQGGGRADLLVVDGATGVAQQLLDSVRSVRLLETVGVRLALGVTRRPVGDTTEIFCGPTDLSSALTPVAQTFGELEFGGVATHALGWVAFGVRRMTEEYLVRVDLDSSSAALFAPFSLPYGPAIDATASGEVALSLGVPGIAMGHGLWPLVGAPRLLPVGLRTGQVLPR